VNIVKIKTEYILEHDLKLGDKPVKIRAIVSGNGVTVKPFKGDRFVFPNSHPRLVFLVGELITAAGVLCVNQNQQRTKHGIKITVK
jgi:hypothetical protein